MKREYKLVRVTSVLNWIESNWKEFWWRSIGFEAADKIGKESAEFGTLVHKKIGDNLLGNEHQDESPSSLCAHAVWNWLNENDFLPFFDDWNSSLEIEVKDTKLGLIGHFDCVAIKDGVTYIIDFKTSNKMRKSFPLQKAAYARMTNKQFGIKIDKGITIRSHWDKEKECVEFEVKQYDNLTTKYWKLFKSCLEIYKYFTRKEK